jgi:hypothetical protein
VTVRPGTFTFIDASDMLLLIDRTPGIVNSNSQLGRIVAQHNEARADQMIGWLFATLRPGVKSSAVAAQMSGVQFAGGTDVLEVIELFTAVPQVVMVLSFGTLAAAFAARDLVSSALKDHVSVERICY